MHPAPSAQAQPASRHAATATATATAAATAALLAALLAAPPALAAVTANLTPHVRHQTMDGFGTAVQGDSEAFYGWDVTSNSPTGGNYNAARVDQYVDLMFNTMNASILRFEVGHYAAAPRTGLERNTGLDYTADPGIVTAGQTIPNTTDTYTPLTALAANQAKLDMDAYRVRPAIQMAQRGLAYNPKLKLVGTVWTPPYTMKNNSGLNAATGDLNGGNHDAAQRDAFAHYVTAWAADFEDEVGQGSLHGLSVQNEPGFFPGYNSSGFAHPEDFALTLAATRDTLDAAGFQHVKLFGPEMTGISIDAHIQQGQMKQADGPFFSQQQYLFHVKNLEAQRALENKPRILDIVATHGADGRSLNPLLNTTNDTAAAWHAYWHGNDPDNNDWALDENGQQQWVGAYRQVLPDDQTPNGYTYADLPGTKNILDSGENTVGWMTEFAGAQHLWAPQPGDPGVNPDFAPFGALDQAIATYEALVYGNQSAYVLWQLAHDTTFGDPNRDPFLLAQRENEALLKDLDDTDAPKLAAFRHFSTLIEPGMERFTVGLGDDLIPARTQGQLDPTQGVAPNNRGDQVLATGFIDDGDSKLTLVLINPTGQAQDVTLNLQALLGDPNFAGLQQSGLFAFLSDETKRYHAEPDVTINAQGEANFTLPKESIATLANFSQRVSAIPEPAVFALSLVGFALVQRRPIRQ